MLLHNLLVCLQDIIRLVIHLVGSYVCDNEVLTIFRYLYLGSEPTVLLNVVIQSVVVLVTFDWRFHHILLQKFNLDFWIYELFINFGACILVHFPVRFQDVDYYWVLLFLQLLLDHIAVIFDG